MFGFLGGIKLLGCVFADGRRATPPPGCRNLGADYVKLDMYFVSKLAIDTKKQEQLRELVEKLEALELLLVAAGWKTSRPCRSCGRWASI